MARKYLYDKPASGINSYQKYLTQYNIYLKLRSSNTSCFETHAGLFRLSMKGIFDIYVL